MDNGFGAVAADWGAQQIGYDSPGHVEAVLARHGVDQRITQFGKAPFKAELLSAGGGGIELVSERYETAGYFGCSPPTGCIGLICLGGSEAEYRVNGSVVGDGAFVFLPLDNGADFVCSGRFGADSITVPVDRFSSIVADLCLDSDFTDAVTVVAANDVRAALLRKEIGAQCNQRVLDLDRIADLIDSAVAYVGNSLSRGPLSRPSAAYRRRSAKEVQEFIDAHYMNPIRNAEICRACNIGVRTLQRIFRDYFGITTTDYIKAVRLDKAFRTLRGTNPGEATVAEIATSHGFSHLGRFSSMYKEQFGESPSRTLRSS